MPRYILGTNSRTGEVKMQYYVYLSSRTGVMEILVHSDAEPDDPGERSKGDFLQLGKSRFRVGSILAIVAREELQERAAFAVPGK